MNARASREADGGGPHDAAAIEHAALVRLLIAKGVITYDELVTVTAESAKVFRETMVEGFKNIDYDTTDEQIVELAKASQARISKWLRTGT